jgi:hypothetical protein
MTGEQRDRGAGQDNATWLARSRGMLDRLEAREGMASAAPFVHSGSWLVRARYLPTIACYWLLPPHRRLPGLPRVKALHLIGQWISPLDRRVSLRTAAEALQLADDGNRLRALYLGDRPRSLKLVAVTRRQEMRPDQEVMLRARVAALGTIRVPKVYVSGIEDGVAVTEEELVLGRRLMVRYDLRFVRDVLVPKLLATYRAAGLRYEPLARHVAIDLAARLPAGEFRDAVARLLVRTPEVAVSFCHGDFLPSNIVVSRNDAVVMDWENAGEGIAAFDLLTLALRYSRNRRLFAIVESAVRSHLSERGARFEDLLLLALATRVARQPASLGKVPGWVLRTALAP